MVDGPFYDDFNHRKWRVVTPCCGTTYEPLILTIRSMLDRRGIIPCAVCGGKERMKKAFDSYIEIHGIDYDLNDFQDYSRKARGLSDQTYAIYQSIINPDNLTRGIVENHLDHKIPILWCFRNKIPPELAASVLNLQMLPYDENIRKLAKIPEDPMSVLTGGIINLLDYQNPVFDPTKFNLWPFQLSTKAFNSMLVHRVKQAEKLNARDTEIRIVPPVIEKQFLNDSHLAGWAKSDIAYGLYFKDELVCIATLGKPRFNKHYQLEVIRLASKPGVIVRGGASKLFSYIKKNHTGKLLSYSDSNIGEGKVYELCGFQFAGFTGSSYFWEKNGEIWSRYKTQKHKLKDLLGEDLDMAKSETQLMKEAGWTKVYNLPNRKWEMQLGSY